MKRVLFVILGTAGLMIGTSSCEKTCTCETYENGVLVEKSEDFAEAGEKCSDLNEYDRYGDQVDEVRCY